MITTYKGEPLNYGDKIPGTALTFVQPILPRRGEFLCECGRAVGLDISAIERGDRITCGCRCYRKENLK